MQSSFSAIAHTSRDHDVLGKVRPLHYQAPFVDVSLLATGPNAIILTVNRRVQVKVFFSSVKKTFFANFTGRRRISFLQRSWRFCLTDSEMIWAGTRRKTNSRSRFTIRWTDDRWMFSCSAIFLVLLLVLGWFSCEQISSPTCSIISGVRTDLGRPPPCFLMRADPVSSTRLQISLTVSSFQFFFGYFAAIARYPSPCSCNVWILILSSTETLPMTPAINK